MIDWAVRRRCGTAGWAGQPRHALQALQTAASQLMRPWKARPGQRAPGGAPLVMNFLLSTLRDWKVTLEPMADRNPVQLKVACARAER